MIWGGWIVSTRSSLTTYLAPLDVGLLRFGVPALVLAPIWIRTGLIPKGVPIRVLIPLIAGSGVFFSLSISNGMVFAPAAHTGALVPGTIPLWAALIGLAVFSEKFSRSRIIGFFMMALGAMLLGGASAFMDTLNDGAWRGHLLFLFSAFMWACYAHAFKRSGLSALEAIAVSSVWSAVVHGVLAYFFGSSLVDIETDLLLWQILLQGILSGIVAVFAFSLAISYLGPTRATAFQSLVPAIAAFGGWIAIGEPLISAEIVAIICVTIGVALASGLIKREMK